MEIQTIKSKSKDYIWSRYEFYTLEVNRIKKDIESSNIGSLTIEQLHGQLDYAISRLEIYVYIYCLIEKEDKL